MAENPIKKSDIADFEGIQKAVNDLIASLEKLSRGTHKELKESADAVAKSLQGISASSTEGQAAIASAAKATDGLIAEQKQLVAVDKQLSDARAKLNVLQNEGVQQKIKETAETKKSISEKQKEITQGKAAADSYVVLIAKLKQLRDAWKLAGEAGRKDLAPQIEKIDKQLKNLDKTIGQHQRNVGNYGSALKGVATNILAATGLTAGLAGGIKLMGSVIQSTNLGADKFNFFLGGMKEGMGFLARSLSNLDFTNLIKGFRDAYTEGKRYAEELGNIDDLQGALGLQKQDIETDIIRQRIIAKNRSLDLQTRQAALDEIIRLEELKLLRTQEVNDRALKNELDHAESISKVRRDIIVDYIENSDKYTDELAKTQELENKLRADAIEITYTKIGDAMVQTATVSMPKYKKAVSELSEEQQKLLEILKLDKALTGAKDQGVRGNITKALTDQKNAVNELARAEETLVRLRNSLYNELIKEEAEATAAATKGDDERIKSATAALEAASKVRTKSIQDQAKADQDIEVGAQELSNKLIEIKKQEVQQVNDLESTKEQFAKETNQAILRDKIAAMEDEFQILSDASQVLGDIFAAQKQRELNAAGDNAQKREEIERDYFKKEQSLAIAQAVINGALAVTKVTAQTGILSPFAIPLIVATTLGQIALISSQKFAEGGYTGDGSYRDETGQKVAGIVHEKEFVLDRDSTKKYRPLIEAIHEDDPAKIAAIVSNEHMHNIWGNMNKAIGSSQDPYTRLMYDLMKSQPSIYVDSDGNTVLQYIGRKQVIRKN